MNHETLKAIQHNTNATHPRLYHFQRKMSCLRWTWTLDILHSRQIYHIYITFSISLTSLLSGLDFSTPWRDSYEAARSSLSTSLHITHPVMPCLLTLWEEQAPKSILDLSHLRLGKLYIHLHRVISAKLIMDTCMSKIWYCGQVLSSVLHDACHNQCFSIRICACYYTLRNIY